MSDKPKRAVKLNVINEPKDSYTGGKSSLCPGCGHDQISSVIINAAWENGVEPHRIAKMYVDEVFGGLDYSQFPKITLIENKMNVEEMVCVEDIDLTSTCEHHFVTIDGSAKVAYIPKNTVIGLSKINRLVRFFAQRPQVQERLTQQILVAMQTLLGTEDVAVTISAVHYCVKARGVKDGNSSTRTTSLGGVFKSDPASRAEFLS